MWLFLITRNFSYQIIVQVIFSTYPSSHNCWIFYWKAEQSYWKLLNCKRFKRSLFSFASQTQLFFLFYYSSDSEKTFLAGLQQYHTYHFPLCTLTSPIWVVLLSTHRQGYLLLIKIASYLKSLSGQIQSCSSKTGNESTVRWPNQCFCISRLLLTVFFFFKKPCVYQLST